MWGITYNAAALSAKREKENEEHLRQWNLLAK
jgi:hypothetical protein